MSKKILFLVTGSIAAYKSCEVISTLKKQGHHVRVALSTNASAFVTALTFEALSGEKVYCDQYERDFAMSHIDLERWADLIVVCPATANTLNKFAQGDAQDLLGSLFLAHEFKKPFLIFPAMNSAMWNHPATRKSVVTLKDWGIKVYAPESGALACGETGVGRLLEPQKIAQIISDSVTEKAQKKYRILVTGGGTTEAIDSVRTLSNSSTGTTASGIAQFFDQHGCLVDYVGQQGSQLPAHYSSLSTFRSFQDLSEILMERLRNQTYDAIIHCAAVSDYFVSQINGQTVNKNLKISSESENLNITLKKNPKLISLISGLIDPTQTTLVAFKLTSHADENKVHEAVDKIFTTTHSHFVVQNDMSTIRDQNHVFKIFKRDFRTPVAKGETKAELNHSLFNQIEHHLISTEHQEEWL